MAEKHSIEERGMNSAQKRPAPEAPQQWRKSRPLTWRLRSLINQRRRGRG
jgi:hypothetical protein